MGPRSLTLFYIKNANFTPWNVSKESAIAAIGAPFSDTVNTMFGGTWAGNVLAVAVIISGFGALNGWTMICAEMPKAAADDGLFPERFKRISKRGLPAYGIVASTALASIAMIINYLGSNGATVFTTLVLMTGITAAIPYAFSALAQLKWRVIDHRTMQTPRFARDMVVAVLALVFSVLFIVYSRNTGHSFWVPVTWTAAGRNHPRKGDDSRGYPGRIWTEPEEANHADCHRPGRERAPAAIGSDDHRGAAAEHPDRAPGHRSAGRGAQHRRGRCRPATRWPRCSP